MVTTRIATDRDLPFLERTFLVTLRDAITGARGNWDEVRERRQFHDQLQLEQTRIVCRNGNDVGFFTTTSEADRLLLGTLCVAPEYQSQGIGAKVMTDVVAAAQDQGVALVLFVLKSNPRARTFYERLGFVVVGESAHHHRLQYVSGTCAA